jgi:AcrR family transcriptional regulator
VARPRPGLTRSSILSAALHIIDESGLEACTMRAVAAELGVEAMSLYWHVPGKDALLDGVVELVLGEVEGAQGQVTTWQQAFMVFGHAFRGVLRRHPAVVPLVVSRPMAAYAAAAQSAERTLGLLEAAGFDRATAVRIVRTMGRFVVGSTLLEIGVAEAPRPPRDEPALADLVDAVQTDDPAEFLTFGLETMIAGLEERLRRA